mgnify:CR=1 FL=1
MRITMTAHSAFKSIAHSTLPKSLGKDIPLISSHGLILSIATPKPHAPITKLFSRRLAHVGAIIRYATSLSLSLSLSLSILLFFFYSFFEIKQCWGNYVVNQTTCGCYCPLTSCAPPYLFNESSCACYCLPGSCPGKIRIFFKNPNMLIFFFFQIKVAVVSPKAKLRVLPPVRLWEVCWPLLQHLRLLRPLLPPLSSSSSSRREKLPLPSMPPSPMPRMPMLPTQARCSITLSRSSPIHWAAAKSTKQT